MKVVKLLDTVTVGTTYGAGEVAGFDDDVADDLIERELAEPVAVKKGKGGEPLALERAD